VQEEVDEARPVDWVLLATKAQQTPQAGLWLARLCRPGTVVVVLQNGVDQVARVAPLADGATVLPARSCTVADGASCCPPARRPRHSRRRDHQARPPPRRAHSRQPGDVCAARVSSSGRASRLSARLDWVAWFVAQTTRALIVV